MVDDGGQWLAVAKDDEWLLLLRWWCQSSVSARWRSGWVLGCR